MQHRSVQWRSVVILFLALGIIFYVVMSQTKQQLASLQTRSEQLQATYASLDQENKELQSELKYVSTDTYVEEAARSELGYVRNGEIQFHFASIDVLKGYTESEWNALLEEFRE